jgi:hypothetical protein
MACFHDPVNRLKLNTVSTVVCELRPPPAFTLTVNHSALLSLEIITVIFTITHSFIRCSPFQHFRHCRGHM